MTKLESTRSIVIERELPYPPEKVWRALTERALIEEWLMASDFAPLVGRKFNFRAPPAPHWNGVTDCEVIEVEPMSRLSYTWNSSREEAANGLKTIVIWTLAPTRAGVLLRTEHSGFRADQETNYHGASYGWTKFVDGLERVVQE